MRHNLTISTYSDIKKCKTECMAFMSQDMMEKRAFYVHKVNELIQEFHFTDPSTKIMINNIFNTRFYGSQLWDFFYNEAERVKNLGISHKEC